MSVEIRLILMYLIIMWTVGVIKILNIDEKDFLEKMNRDAMLHLLPRNVQIFVLVMGFMFVIVFNPILTPMWYIDNLITRNKK